MISVSVYQSETPRTRWSRSGTLSNNRRNPGEGVVVREGHVRVELEEQLEVVLSAAIVPYRRICASAFERFSYTRCSVETPCCELMDRQHASNSFSPQYRVRIRTRYSSFIRHSFMVSENFVFRVAANPRPRMRPDDLPADLLVREIAKHVPVRYHHRSERSDPRSTRLFEHRSSSCVTPTSLDRRARRRRPLQAHFQSPVQPASGTSSVAREGQGLGRHPLLQQRVVRR